MQPGAYELDERRSRDFYLFEFGSTSLKFYFRASEDARIQKVKVPWEIGHEVPQTGRISVDSAGKAVSSIRSLLSTYGNKVDPRMVVAFATGVFRVALNTEDFLTRIRNGVGLTVRVISGDQEAALLKALYLRKRPDLPTFAFDLGGGTMQWVAARTEEDGHRGSIPLGVIWIFRHAKDGAGEFSADRAEEIAASLLAQVPSFRVAQIVGTGGTIKAICRSIGENPITLDALEDLEKRVRKDGPPADLKPHRKPIFLPGILVALQILKKMEARRLRYEDLSVGKAMLEKVIPFYDQAEVDPHPSDILKGIHYSAILPAPPRPEESPADSRLNFLNSDTADGRSGKAPA